MLEYEKKIPLAVEEYLYLWYKLMQAPITVLQYTQINYYYDTDDLAMNRLGITCRIREKNGAYTATIKEHACGSAECSTEISQEARNECDDVLFADKGLKLQGKLTTERLCIPSERGLEIVMDKNTYLGCTDYELEIEYRPKNEMQADKFVHYLADTLGAVFEGVNYADLLRRQASTRSKSARFFQRLEMTNLQKGGENGCYRS